MDLMGSAMVMVIVMIVVYLLVRRRLAKYFAKVSEWQKTIADTRRNAEGIKMAKSIVSSLNSASIEVINNEMQTLIGMGDVAVGPLIVALKSTNPVVRRAAVKALGAIGDSRAVAPLIRLAGDPDIIVRMTLAGVLANFDDIRIVDPLLSLLRDKDFYVCRAALQPFSLGKVKHALAVDAIVGFLGDKETNTRLEAVKALGCIGNARATGPLIETLEDPDWIIQEHAIWALKEIGDLCAVPPLLRMLEHEVSYIRIEAAKALASIGDRNAIDPVQNAVDREANSEVKSALLAALHDLRNPPPKFVKPLEDAES